MQEREISKGWLVAVDRGGTFTDIVGLSPEGGLHVEKLLSSSPDYDDPSIEGVRRMLSRSGAGMDELTSLRLGSTVATNALLERKGGRVLLIINRGMRDLLRIGHQSRPDIFALSIEKPAALYSDVVEAGGRIGPDGAEEEPLDLSGLEAAVAALGHRPASVAVALMHSWKNPSHEAAVGWMLTSMGFEDVHLSHRVEDHIKIITRGQSAVVNAYLSPVVRTYMDSISDALRSLGSEAGSTYMLSSGRLAPPGALSPKDLLLSGPAGGVMAVAGIIGAIENASGMRTDGAIGFDMGGTSTDVCRYSRGEAFERRFERTVSGLEIQGDMLDINTVASGGGSLLRFLDGRMQVGPESAGADPGPACYGLGGPLAMTDANLLTGRIVGALMPGTFGPGRDGRIDHEAARRELAKLTEEINAHAGSDLTPEQAALGFIRIGNEHMARAIREISVSRGYDVRDYGLISFGGAGGQHACSVASILGMKTIVFHPLASVMSAFGIGLSRPARIVSRSIMEPYGRALHESLLEEITASAVRGGDMKAEVELRPGGSDSPLVLGLGGFDDTLDEFKKRYLGIYGLEPGDAIEAVSLRCEIPEAEGPFFSGTETPEAGGDDIKAPVSQPVWFGQGTDAVSIDTPVLLREGLDPDSIIEGPALIVDRYSTFVLYPGFSARVIEGGIIVATAHGKKGMPIEEDDESEPSPVLLEVFNNSFMGIAAEMGLNLRKTARSVNIKERLDFSCAVFDRDGGLVANAPHIPVHLGSMSETVAGVIKVFGAGMRPGDMYITNDPYAGGSHLPDITVVSPVFTDEGKIIFFLASRGHHADIGGTTPGSMPAEASHIDEEGVLISPMLLVRDGRMVDGAFELLSGGEHPARNMPERIGDLRAQVAACAAGAVETGRLIKRYGLGTVLRYMGHVQDNAELSVRNALMGFTGSGGGSFRGEFSDMLDDGTPVCVSIAVEAGGSPPGTVRARIDFSGTGEEHMSDNLNAPLAVTRSAVLYVLRLLTRRDIPLNSGCLKPVEIIVPEGCILNPRYPAPVASGNVETSQRVVDVLLGAFGVAAASQGTMNNLLFEVEGETPYYETIAGGSGATAGNGGASGVQVHMTNTRMTDPEVLELRHPGVRLDAFHLIDGTGGEGLHRGGEGVLRQLRFLRRATVSVISERRLSAPYGLSGGGPGARGRNVHVQRDGNELVLPHRTVICMEAGEAIRIETPGGGGFGRG